MEAQENQPSADVPEDVSRLAHDLIERMNLLHPYAGRPAWVSLIAKTILADRQAREEARDGGGWRTIDSAPKDGARFLAFGVERPFLPPRAFVSRWDAERAGGAWVGPIWRCQPTHWMPFPAPPAIEPSPVEGDRR